MEENKLQIISVLKGYLKEIETKGIKGLETNQSFLLGYEQCIEHVEAIIHENIH